MSYMTSKKFQKLRRLIREYGDARVAGDMKGGTDPESIPFIENRLVTARKNLFELVTQLEKEMNEWIDQST